MNNINGGGNPLGLEDFDSDSDSEREAIYGRKKYTIEDIILCINTNNLECLQEIFSYVIISDFRTLKDENGINILFLAIDKGNLEIIKYLIKQATDTNGPTVLNILKNERGQTLFLFACTKNNLEIIQYLYSPISGLEKVDNFRNTCLILASYIGNPDIVNFLLEEAKKFGEAFSIVNIQNEYGNTPLIVACENGHYDVVNLLLQNDANINLQDNEAWTPLMWASTNGHLDIVKLLLIMGANKDLRNSTGQTALQLALDNNNEEVAYLLRNWDRTMAMAILKELKVDSGYTFDPSLIKDDLKEYMGEGGRKIRNRKSNKNKKKSSKNKRKSSKKRK